MPPYANHPLAICALCLQTVKILRHFFGFLQIRKSGAFVTSDRFFDCFFSRSGHLTNLGRILSPSFWPFAHRVLAHTLSHVL